MTIPIELIVDSSSHKGSLLVLLDLGCTRCLVNSTLVEKLGLQLQEPKVSMTFCQLDGSVAAPSARPTNKPATFVTEPIEMRLGAHTETLSFIVVSGMERPLVLGLVWLPKWNSCMNSRRRLLAPLGKKTKKNIGAAMQESPKGDSWIPNEYWDLQDMFNEKGLDKLPPHYSIDCGIEILLGARFPKPKLYSMTPREGA